MTTIVHATPSLIHCLAKNRSGRGTRRPLISAYANLARWIREAAIQTSPRYGIEPHKSSGDVMTVCSRKRRFGTLTPKDLQWFRGALIHFQIHGELLVFC